MSLLGLKWLPVLQNQDWNITIRHSKRSSYTTAAVFMNTCNLWTMSRAVTDNAVAVFPGHNDSALCA